MPEELALEACDRLIPAGQLVTKVAQIATTRYYSMTNTKERTTVTQAVLYRALRTAGVPEELALEASDGLIPAEQLVTKTELKAQLAELEIRLSLRIVAISASINALMLTVAVAFIKLV